MGLGRSVGWGLGWRRLAEPSPEGEVERDVAGAVLRPDLSLSGESVVSARMDVALLAKL
jgi:hypothetical protein